MIGDRERMLPAPSTPSPPATPPTLPPRTSAPRAAAVAMAEAWPLDSPFKSLADNVVDSRCCQANEEHSMHSVLPGVVWSNRRLPLVVVVVEGVAVAICVATIAVALITCARW